MERRHFRQNKNFFLNGVGQTYIPRNNGLVGSYHRRMTPSIMLHEFTKNRSRSSFKMTNNLGSALILAGLDSLQSPLRPPTYGALENSEYLISLNAAFLGINNSRETLEAFANLLENNVKSLNKNTLSSPNAARDNAIAESYLLSACRLLHTCIFKLASDRKYQSTRKLEENTQAAGSAYFKLCSCLQVRSSFPHQLGCTSET